MNSAYRAATTQRDAPLLPLAGAPVVHQTVTGAAHIELEFTGGRKLLIVLDNATREDLILKLSKVRK